jgi:hypothetical protein
MPWRSRSRDGPYDLASFRPFRTLTPRSRIPARWPLHRDERAPEVGCNCNDGLTPPTTRDHECGLRFSLQDCAWGLGRAPRFPPPRSVPPRSRLSPNPPRDPTQTHAN